MPGTIITAKYFAEAVDLTNKGEIEDFLANRFKISEKPFPDRLNFYTDLMTVLCGKDKILVTKTKNDLKKCKLVLTQRLCKVCFYSSRNTRQTRKALRQAVS